MTDRADPRIIVLLGLGLTLVGTLPFAFGTGNWILLGVALLVRGGGLGILMTPLMATVYTGLKPTEIAHGTIASRIFQQVGGAFGVALMAIVVENVAGRGGFIVAFLISVDILIVSLLPTILLRKPVAKTAAEEIEKSVDDAPLE
jgi:MFS family permease